MKETSKSPKVLVIEDEVGLQRLLRFSLERNGYDVVEAATGDEGMDAVNNSRPDAVLLDMSLPDMDGLSVLKRLREWTQVPVLILSECTEEAEKIAALDGGANDYVTKPFSTAEVLARVRVTQRYYAQPPRWTEVFEIGDLSVNLIDRIVKVRGEKVKLSPIEYSLLRLFVQNAGKVLTHRQILSNLWGAAEGGNRGYLRVYLSFLRSKLEANPAKPELLITEPGVGYRLALQE